MLRMAGSGSQRSTRYVKLTRKKNCIYIYIRNCKIERLYKSRVNKKYKDKTN